MPKRPDQSKSKWPREAEAAKRSVWEVEEQRPPGNQAKCEAEGAAPRKKKHEAPRPRLNRTQKEAEGRSRPGEEEKL